MDRQYNPQRKQNSLEPFLRGTPVKTDPFGENRSAQRAYTRAERIAGAMYILTAHLSSEEPLIVSLRAEALNLLTVILALRATARATDSPEMDAARGSIRALISYVKLLIISGGISAQNGEIVLAALDELGVFLISSQRSALSERTAFSREDFETTGSLIGQISYGGGGRVVSDSPSVKDRRDMSVTKGTTDTLRKQAILEILRSSREDFGIKDIASNLPQYSEKMVQRDLAGLVAAGKVKKTGLKRWSKYSII